MNCQNCESPVPNDAERCERCGAKLLHRRIVFGAPRPEDFKLTLEEPREFVEPVEQDHWSISQQKDVVAFAPSGFAPSEAAPEIAYGGFFRRALAFVIDLVTIVLLSALMGAMAYVGYKVGLAAHGRLVSLDNITPLFGILTFAWIFLANAYFVVFHGSDGKTVGKWLLGLRVVDAAQTAISYRRAFLRCIGLIGFGCATFGLSCLWIIWSGEKRGWHDYLARTWVVRD
jgi:uncharacterized RDD family membrane protein YckC